jgi:hypothetical protein
MAVLLAIDCMQIQGLMTQERGYMFFHDSVCPNQNQPMEWHCSMGCIIAVSICILLVQAQLEQFQQFGKPTWYPYNFGKTRKIGLQQFGKPTWQKYKLGKTHLPTRIYARADHGCHRCFPLGGLFPFGWEGEKEIKNREGFLM